MSVNKAQTALLLATPLTFPSLLPHPRALTRDNGGIAGVKIWGATLCGLQLARVGEFADPITDAGSVAEG